ncbi:Xaa-Pro aminopeptidase [Marinitoga hydrogenitolerans DSM 16785]|uniref:Xaa-Pro aminopeptidase n=1 Tax=Marinitoga hydrogenitolerans (strain DSM 16785 / JCM 12826 / AT1271) TaxID=1122195 RepID=A0A1M4XRX2_MARH1|nr:Xaa-Pro peptidase family protein [Marinitoga hydrogenitolerans]SHE96116.1 Xaa-Pro aminopeptidase [Marinitoga hydrogenitolerans DSM 16785]
MFENRIKELRRKMLSKGLDAYLVINIEGSSKPSSYYLTGFTGSFSVIYITHDHISFLTDGRYLEQAEKETGIKPLLFKSKLSEALKDIFDVKKGSKIGFESNNVSTNIYLKVLKSFEDYEFIPAEELIIEMRRIKSKKEVTFIKNAAEIAERALEETLDSFYIGMTEKEFAAKLEYNMKLIGADNYAFETIVASGPRGALPHGIASNKKIFEGELIVIDFGAYAYGYNSDITRTVAVNKISPKQREIYELVLKAQKAAIDAAKAGMKYSDLDKIARDIISKGGYGEYFTHSLGHGLGLEVHENPRVSKISEAVSKVGDVITIEPGIYLPGEFGVRIEDDILITEDGCEVLTSFDKNLIIIS